MSSLVLKQEMIKQKINTNKTEQILLIYQWVISCSLALLYIYIYIWCHRIDFMAKVVPFFQIIVPLLKIPSRLRFDELNIIHIIINHFTSILISKKWNQLLQLVNSKHRKQLEKAKLFTYIFILTHWYAKDHIESLLNQSFSHNSHLQ